jgi:hypothetical protein
MTLPALALVVALYAAIATAYVEARRRSEPPPRWARVAGVLAVLVHLAALVRLSHEIHRSPFATSGQALSFLAFSLAALYVVLEATSRVPTHGGSFFFAAALAAACGLPNLLQSGGDLPEALAGGLLGVGYLRAYRRVKRHSLGPGSEGPPLSGYERMERRASGLGLLLLGPSIVLGIVAAREAGAAPGTAWLVGATGVLFLLLALAGFLWWRRPLLGSLAAWLNVACTLVALLSFAVVHPLVLKAGS